MMTIFTPGSTEELVAVSMPLLMAVTILALFTNVDLPWEFILIVAMIPILWWVSNRRSKALNERFKLRRRYERQGDRRIL